MGDDACAGEAARGGGVVSRVLGLASSDPAGDAQLAMLGGAHLTHGCPETLVDRLGLTIAHLHRRLLAAGRLGVVIVLDELWALREWQAWRAACVSLWSWSLLRAAAGPTLVGLSGTFSRGQVRGERARSQTHLQTAVPTRMRVARTRPLSAPAPLP